MRHARPCARFLLPPGVLLALTATSASAHHVMDGKLPKTLMDGILSGLGHPVIGVDHLVMILALGVIAAYVAVRHLVPMIFVAASVAGVLVHVAEVSVPTAESLVAATLVVAGLAFIFGRLREHRPWIAFAGFAGLVHGYAFGESIVGAENTPLVGYLIGLSIVQIILSLATMTWVGMLLTHDAATSGRVRAAGGVLVALGILYLATSFAPA